MAQCAGVEYCTPVIKASEFMLQADRPNYLVFAQVNCTQTEATLQNKYMWTLFLACICILMSYIYIGQLNAAYVDCIAENKYADICLTTPDDYALRFLIPIEMYEHFKNYYEQN